MNGIKIDKTKSASAQKKIGKEKGEQIMQNAKKIKARENNFSLEVNTAVLEALWIAELRDLNILGFWIWRENFLTFVLQ